MSVEAHRLAERAMGYMEHALSAGDIGRAATEAEIAAAWEERTLAILRERCPERQRTIQIIETSARSLRERAVELRQRARAS